MIVAPDRYETIRDTVAHLAAQSNAGELELVVVAPSRAALTLDAPELRRFRSHSLVEIPELRSVAAARAAGIAEARSDVVALAEDHAFPQAGWAGALLERHGEGYAGVGPTLTNANPATATSWADLFLSYGPFVERADSSRVDSLPGDNSSYRTDVLRALGPRLVELLDDERALHEHLRAAGHELFLEAGARLRHVNVSRRASFVRLRYHGGREYGARRASAEGWGSLRRVVHALAAPVSVPLQLAPVLRHVRASARSGELLPRIVPALSLAVCAGVAGETVGYLAGPGSSPAKVTAFKFHRLDHVRAADRALLDASP